MKNIYTLSSGRIDRPQFILSLFFLAVFLMGPFSARYADLHSTKSHVMPYYENHSGSYSLFITLHDSVTGIYRDASEKKDTSFSVPLQKSNLNVVIW
jgi:hypothetical protein